MTSIRNLGLVLVSALALLTAPCAQAAANLQATNVTVTATNSYGVASGDYVTVTWAVTNNDASVAGTTTTTFTDLIWLSSTSACTPSSTLFPLGRVARTGSVTNATWYTNGAVVRIPPAITPLGTWYVIVQADALNVLSESNESDNDSASSSFTLYPEVLAGGAQPVVFTDTPGIVSWRSAWGSYQRATNNGYSGTSGIPLTSDSKDRLALRQSVSEGYLTTNKTIVQPWNDLTLTNTSMTNIVIGNGSVFRLSTLIGTVTATNHTICGITNWQDGRVIAIETGNGQTNTFANSSATETVAANRILTGTGSDFVHTNIGFVVFQYDGSRSRWVLRSRWP